MARHSAMQIVPEFMLKSSLDIKKHVSAKLLDMLMRAVKVEALFGETIVSLEPITEELGPEAEGRTMYELKPCPFCGTPMNLAKDRTLVGFHDDDCFFCLLEEREVAKEGQPERYERIRYKAKMLAAYINENCPESREKSLALTKIDEAVMWANAAIARNE